MLIALLLLSANPPVDIRTTCVDTIERNTVYCDQTGRVMLEQWIFWDHARRRSRCVAWRPHRGEVAERTPAGWRLLWSDQGTLREVRAVSYQRTWTPTDPEVEDRGWWPQEWRRGLCAP